MVAYRFRIGLQLIVIILPIIDMCVSARTTQSFVRSLSIQGLLPSSEYLTKGTVRSKLDCSSKCTSDDVCKSFAYVTKTRLCQTYCDVYTNPNGMTHVNTASYYTSPQAYTPNECPSSQDDLTTVVLPGEHFQYSLKTGPLKQSEAHEACYNVGTRLMMIHTEAKMVRMRWILENCGQNQSDVWVDGSNAEADDFNDINAWKTKDGRSLNMTVGVFWEYLPEEPAEHCVRFKLGDQYLWNDYQCNRQCSYICEKVC